LKRLKVAGLAVAMGLVAATGAVIAVPAQAHTIGIHDNCTNLNKKWPHGVGMRRAVDKSSGVRVTTFYRNSDAYRAADAHNGTLDRDNDNIACEKL